MTGIPKVDIAESANELKALMKQQKTSLNYAKVQALYLLKIEAAQTIRYVAVLVGREETTIHRWIRLYKEEGIEGLLTERPKTGRPQKMEIETVAKLQQELRDEEGFKSYKEIEMLCVKIWEIPVSYATVYRVVHEELKAKLKVPRPQSNKQKQGVIEEWIKDLVNKLKALKKKAFNLINNNLNMTYWCQDETRLGLRTIPRRKITLFGVKPRGILQWQFDYYYIYGLVNPTDGRSFFCEFSHLNSDCFQLFLETFSQQYQKEIHIIQLDNAPCHTAKKLVVPENIILLFQPPYCPEVNPIERFWQFLKEDLCWSLFDSLDGLKEKVANTLNSIKAETIYSLTGWDYILRALSLAGL